ncbi:MAG: Calx-beta domain-containing protein, partial [Chitinivibrionales bacterium]|nr:Calx-beta domain-containing protein [Chitinivibrionales bacterium]
MQRIVGIALLALCGLGLLVCTSDTNPYLNPSRATIAFSGLPYNKIDTLEIFHTFSFTCEFMLQKFLDSVSIHIDHNRLWPLEDSIIKNFDSISGSLPITVSFSDTGWNKVTVTAYKSTGDIIKDSLIFYCTSPLKQAFVVADLGQTITLQTHRVSDDNVLYAWEFNTLPAKTIITSTTDSAPLSITKELMPVRSGLVYVIANGIRSSAFEFPVYLTDKTTPSATSLNHLVQNDSEITTGADPFAFRIAITNQAGVTILPLVNGSNFDFYDTGALAAQGVQTCTKTIADIKKSPGDSMKLFVTFADKTGRIFTQTFWVHYDSTLTNLDAPVIALIAPRDGESVTNPALTLQGTITNNFSYDSLFLVLQLNGAVLSKFPVVTKDSLQWSATATLLEGTNNLTVSAYDNAQHTGNPVAVKSFALVYNPAAVDTTPPSINNITIGGQKFDSTRTYYFDSARIGVTANITDGSGVQSVIINATAAAHVGDLYSGTAALTHNLSGTTITIRATDTKNNDIQKSLKVFKNALPVFQRVPLSATAIVGQPSIDSVSAADADGDSVDIRVTIPTAKGDTVFKGTGKVIFNWTPQAADTAKSPLTISITALDGYQAKDTSFSCIVVSSSGAIPPAHFITTPAQFPETLQVARDTLRKIVRIDKNLLSGPYSMSAKIMETNFPVLPAGRDSLVKWTPLVTDTGTRTLLVVVFSGTLPTDSLKIPLKIIPPVFISFESSQSGALESVGTAFVPIVLSVASKDTVKASLIVNPTSSASSADYSLPLTTATFAPGTTRFNLPITIVDDTIVETDETVSLGLTVPVNCMIGTTVTHTFTIHDNDTIKRIDTPLVSFNKLDDTGSADAGTIQIPVRLSVKAWLAGLVNIQVSGSAAQGSDFSIVPQNQVQFAVGDSIHFIAITIKSNTECSPLPKTITLTLVNPTNLKLGSNVSYTHTIGAHNIDKCIRPLLYVGSGDVSVPIDKALIDTFKAMNYAVTIIRPAGITDSLVNNSAVIFISVTAASLPVDASRLLNSRAPIFCAYYGYWYPLKLTTTSLLSAGPYDSILLKANNPVINTPSDLSLDISQTYPIYLRPARIPAGASSVAVVP